MSDRTDDAPPPIDDLIARVLRFLAADPDRLTRFFNATGLTAATIRDAANAPGFADSVFDYVLADEPLLLQFAAEAEMRPEALLRARADLEGRGEATPNPKARAAAPHGPSNLARRFGEG